MNLSFKEWLLSHASMWPIRHHLLELDRREGKEIYRDVDGVLVPFFFDKASNHVFALGIVA